MSIDDGAEDDEMEAEYDFSGAVRGKYADRFPPGVAMVVLEPDVAAAFPDAASVNEVLRAIAHLVARRKPPEDKPGQEG